MKESDVWDILIYLFHDQLKRDGQFERIMEELGKHLNEGLHATVVHQAFDLLQEIVGDNSGRIAPPSDNSFRVLDFEETELLGDVGCSLLLTLEQQNILTPYYRELVIHKALELGDTEIDPSLLIWIALMVLLRHEEGERTLLCTQYIALGSVEGGKQ